MVQAVQTKTVLQLPTEEPVWITTDGEHIIGTNYYGSQLGDMDIPYLIFCETNRRAFLMLTDFYLRYLSIRKVQIYAAQASCVYIQNVKVLRIVFVDNTDQPIQILLSQKQSEIKIGEEIPSFILKIQSSKGLYRELPAVCN